MQFATGAAIGLVLASVLTAGAIEMKASADHLVALAMLVPSFAALFGVGYLATAICGIEDR